MKLMFLIPFLLVISVYSVDALAVASDFLEDDTIQLVPGSSVLYGIRIQNPSEWELRVRLVYDEAFINVTGYQDEYTIPPKTNYPIVFNVSAPEDARPDQVYRVSYTVHELSGTGPSLPILVRIAKSFKLKIIRDPNKFYIEDYYPYFTYTIIILLVLFFLLRKKFRKNTFKKGKIIKWKH